MNLILPLLRLFFAAAEKCSGCARVLLDCFRGLFYPEPPQPAEAANSVKSRGKLPRHMCIAVVEDNVSTEDVAKCVGWAAGLGISWITVWDADGQLKRDSVRLEKLVTAACTAERITPVEYRVGAIGRRGRAAGSISNPVQGVIVTVLDQGDGRTDIAHAARGVASAYRRGELKDTDLNTLYPDQFAGWLAVDLPQLDLVFKCGQADTLAGLLPWHISVAEIIKFGSHRGITKDAFIAGMGVFAGSDRRFGR